LQKAFTSPGEKKRERKEEDREQKTKPPRVDGKKGRIAKI